MPLRRFLICAALLIVVLTVTASILVPDFGTLDFPEYWSALRLFRQGINPYSPEQMLEFQRTTFGRPVPIMMWNPPWLLVIMYPALWFDFAVSSRLWILLQGTLLAAVFLVSNNLTARATRPIITNLLILVALLSFPPCYNSVRVGQVGALLAYGCVLVLSGLVRRSPWSIAIGCGILSVKPHLFLLLGTVLVWWGVNEKAYGVLLRIGIVMSALASASELLFPHSLSWWLESFDYKEGDIVPSKYQWFGNVWGNLIEAGLLRSFPDVLLVTSVFCFLTLCFLVFKRPHLNWLALYPIIAATSAYFAPFGWFFDQSVAVLLYFATIYSALEVRRYLLLGILISLHGGALYYMKYVATYHHEMSWYLPVVGLLYTVIVTRKPVTT